MGSCASLTRKSDSSAVKMRPPVGSVAADDFEIPPSPIKEYKLRNFTDSAIKEISVISQTSPAFLTVSSIGHGSKEEDFFDSRPWLDSDCEDFFSVKGDFTPSCGNTPLHNGFSQETPRASKVCNGDQVPGFDPPPLMTAKRRKKLAELFRESFGDEASFAFLKQEENPGLINGEAESEVSESAARGNELTDEKPMGLKLCCFPPLVSCQSSGERKKHLNSAAMAVNGIS